MTFDEKQAEVTDAKKIAQAILDALECAESCETKADFDGTWASCSRKARPGKLTCFWHDRFEAQAQAHAAKMQR